AEDGIRDFHVTGVQTCALPIWARGMAAACTGVGWLKPARSSADNRVGESPRDSKDMCTFAVTAVKRAGAVMWLWRAGVRGSSCRPNQPRCTGEPCAALRQGSGRSGCDVRGIRFQCAALKEEGFLALRGCIHAGAKRMQTAIV